MTLTKTERLILNDSIDDVDLFLSDKAASLITNTQLNLDDPTLNLEQFNLVDFIEFKTKLIKEKYNISDAELTLAFLENIDIANETDKVLRKSVEYKALRKSEYDLLNQDEMRYDDVKNSTTTWVDAIDAIKLAHPKP